MTLVELTIVLVIIGIIIAVLYTQIGGSDTDRVRANSCISMQNWLHWRPTVSNSYWGAMLWMREGFLNKSILLYLVVIHVARITIKHAV